MTKLTDDGQHLVDDLARRHGVSAGAVRKLLDAIESGGGKQAQFSHPDLGGMGQWSRGGMVMVGDMFNDALKAKVDALCIALSDRLGRGQLFEAPAPGAAASTASASFSAAGGPGGRWPAELGHPASSGSQNDLHYAVFPATRRLAIERGGQITVYDTADHAITGFSQSQSHGQTLTFTSQHGLVRLDDLKRVDTPPQHEAKGAKP